MAIKPKKDVVSEIEYTPDLVDAIFRYLLNDTELSRAIKAMNEDQKPLSLQDLKAAVRQEFAGERVYIRSRDGDIAEKVLCQFNGRNATEVSRALGISRASVYRYLKTPGKR